MKIFQKYFIEYFHFSQEFKFYFKSKTAKYYKIKSHLNYLKLVILYDFFLIDFIIIGNF
jgi:hypothetical protein